MKGISCTHFYIKPSRYSSCLTPSAQNLGTFDLWSDVIVPLAGFVSLDSLAENATKVSSSTPIIDSTFLIKMLGVEINC